MLPLYHILAENARVGILQERTAYSQRDFSFMKRSLFKLKRFSLRPKKAPIFGPKNYLKD
jgi:hypothetical protein